MFFDNHDHSIVRKSEQRLPFISLSRIRMEFSFSISQKSQQNEQFICSESPFYTFLWFLFFSNCSLPLGQSFASLSLCHPGNFQLAVKEHLNLLLMGYKLQNSSSGILYNRQYPKNSKPL